MGAGLPLDLTSNVGDTVALDGKVEGRSVILHREGGGVVGGHMAGDEPVDGEVRYDVAVVDEDRISVDPGGDVFHSSPGFEEVGFVEEGQFGSSVGAIGEGLVPSLVEVMGVDREVGDAGREAVVEGVGDERAIAKGDERLRKGVGQRLKAGAETRAEEKCFAHGQRMI